MKKLTITGVILAVSLSLTACANKKEESDKNQPESPHTLEQDS
ncbi:hypothetical protein ABFO59_05410 [Acinetobacter radioresistens]